MSYKKSVICSLLAVGVVALHLKMLSTSLDGRIYKLKRKLNCLNRKLNRVLNKMSEENLKKYKDELKNEYESIKNKIDNLTIRDIKDTSSDLVFNILDNINDLKDKLISY